MVECEERGLVGRGRVRAVPALPHLPHHSTIPATCFRHLWLWRTAQLSNKDMCKEAVECDGGI